MLAHLTDGLVEAAGSWGALVFLLLGVLLGVVVGVIPGLSGVVVVSIALVFIYDLNLQQTLVFFLGVHAASTYSASISSILLNTPAHGEAIPVGFDGFPMSRRGEGARALGISAGATAGGAVVGGVLLVLAYYAADTLGTLIHPPDMVAIIILAMFVVATLGVARVTKGIISVGIGFLLSSVGISSVTGQSRLTFNSIFLMAGISLVVVAIGSFALPQMIELFGSASSVTSMSTAGRSAIDGDASGASRKEQFGFLETMRGVREAFRHWIILLRSAVIGFLGGVIPGVGALTTNYISYGVAKQMSRKRGHLYGTGIPEGVVAAEGSSVAKEEGSKVMTLGLGIPTGTLSALFLVALTIQGVKPGIGFIGQYPVLAYEAVWLLVISTLLGTFFGVLAGPLLARVTRVPGTLLFPFVVAFCIVGVYVVDISYFSLGELLFFALIGVAMRKLGYGLPAFIMGLVLGPTFENNLHLAQAINNSGFVGAMLHRPSAVVIIVLALLVLVAKIVGDLRAARREQSRVRGIEPAAANPYGRVLRRGLRRSGREGRRRRDPVMPVFELLITSLILAVGVVAAIYCQVHYDAKTSALPVVSAALMALGALWQLPGNIAAVVRMLRERGRHRDVGADASVLPVEEADAGQAVSVSLPGMREPLASAPKPPGSHPQLVGAGVVATTVEAPVISTETMAVGMQVVRGSWGRTGQYTREIMGLLWIAGTAAVSYLVGFRLGITAFMVAYGLLAVRGQLQTGRRRLVFALAGAATMYLLVSVLFRTLNLYESPLLPVPFALF